MKKITTLFIALLSLVICANASAQAVGDQFYANRLFYEITNIETPEVKVVPPNPMGWGNTLKPSDDLIIPASVAYDGKQYAVTAIESKAFYNCSDLTSVVIPNSVISIGDEVFLCCRKLTFITIPNSVKTIGELAFSECFSLIGINVETGNTEYSSQDGILFDFNKTTLYKYPSSRTATSYSIPLSVTTVEKFAFWYCSRLTSITIPKSVTVIGEGAFSNCRKLTSIIIPDSVTTIEKSTFFNCSELTSITIPNSVLTISYGAFQRCSSLTSIDIPNSVKTIGSGAFANCIGLTSITIPNSVETIGDGSFRDCDLLTTINVESDNTKYSSQDGILFDFDKTNLIQYPKGKTTATYNIPHSVTTIGNYAFSGCSNLTSTTIPNSVTIIGNYAFADCINLTTTIPNSVSIIGECAFMYCSRLQSITIPNSVTKIGQSAFQNCFSLTSVDIPNSITSIEAYTFSYCDKLTAITIPNSVVTIGSHAFRGCSKLMSINIPNPVKTIGYGSFSGCAELTTIVIPNSVTTIESYAFEQCGELRTVYCHIADPDSVTIEYGVFNHTPTYTLYVPIGSKEKYAVAEQWKKFKNIIEKDYGTEVKSLAEQGFYVTGGEGQILITTDFSLDQSTDVSVYNMSGALVRNVKLATQQTLLPINAGAYIIRIGKAAEKIIVK